MIAVQNWTIPEILQALVQAGQKSDVCSLFRVSQPLPGAGHSARNIHLPIIGRYVLLCTETYADAAYH